MRKGRDVFKHPGFCKHCEFSSCKLRAIVHDEYLRYTIPSKYSFHFFDDATGGHRVHVTNFDKVAIVARDDEQVAVIQLAKVGSNFFPRSGYHFVL